MKQEELEQIILQHSNQIHTIANSLIQLMPVIREMHDKYQCLENEYQYLKEQLIQLKLILLITAIIAILGIIF